MTDTARPPRAAYATETCTSRRQGADHSIRYGLLDPGRRAEAAAELERLLPQVLAASGPRRLGTVTDLSAVAAGVGNGTAAAQLYEALRLYAGRLAVWGGANSVNSPYRTSWDCSPPSLAWQIARLALSDALALRGGDDDQRQSADLQRRAREIAQRLGMTPLLRRLVTPAGEWALRRDPDGWLLEAGEERARLADSRGLRHLRELLAAPRRDISALDLAVGGAGLRVPAGAPVLDAAAAASYQHRLAELAGELDAPQRTRPHLRRGPRAGAHLQASIRTGPECRYDPAPGGPARWRV